MIRAALLALAFALLGGAPYADLLPVWAAAGNMADPDGLTANAGGHADPNGLSAETDAGNMADPNG
jgi:hypothetical protein